jgi:hypothetical protein
MRNSLNCAPQSTSMAGRPSFLLQLLVYFHRDFYIVPDISGQVTGHVSSSNMVHVWNELKEKGVKL